MLESIDISRAGMLRQQQFVDATAHNIANANTPGFKLSRPVLETGESVPASNGDLPPLSGDMQIGRLFTQGALHRTGLATDFAVDGNGFFVVRGPDGTDSYTRDGSFRPDPSGTLVDAAGRTLQPPITIPSGPGTLKVGDDGTVTFLTAGGQAQQLGRLQLAVFTNPNGLLAGADGVFTSTSASGGATLAAPGQGGAGALHQGTLEDPNTDITEQMTNLVTAQRAYQLNTAAFGITDQLLQMADQMQAGG